MEVYNMKKRQKRKTLSSFGCNMYYTSGLTILTMSSEQDSRILKFPLVIELEGKDPSGKPFTMRTISPPATSS
ncbi:hypothetical protein Leryth_002376 [Lithospermum erythrorhizon]|nr:hypothetical protein Leryth_002376 [Lithospermum erythrorhizon]